MEQQPWFYNFWFNSETRLPIPVSVFDAMVLMFTVAAFFPMIKKCDFV
ncbi:MAG: hypothetical protein MJ233_02940 [Mycoplasmoidaceae bacterium]|nr:hypothetical protein [Mycoplasmoidaceae bacterium]